MPKDTVDSVLSKFSEHMKKVWIGKVALASGLLSVAKSARPGDSESQSSAVLKHIDEHGGNVPDE
jgi:hypothetical protein